MPNEIELKLRVAAADKHTLLEHPAIQAHLISKPITRALISIYYDTPDLNLLDAQLSLRVRSMSGGWFQAVKSAGHSVGGLHQRLEWEDLLTKNEPDFNKITEPHLAHIFASESLREALKPVFVVDVMRTDWNLKYPDGTEIEVSLDIGELKICQPRVWEKIDPVNELEIELKHGHTEHLFELALALQKDVPFIIENNSKAQRGYSYLRAEPIIRTHSQATKMPGRNQNPKQMAMDFVSQIQANQYILQKINHTASISQMRYAVAKLREMMKENPSEVSASEKRRHHRHFLHEELAWLDSFLFTPSDYLHHLKLQDTFSSQRYQTLMLNLAAWIYNT